MIFVLVILLGGVGCSTVSRESQRARNVAAATGEGIESGVHTATRKARSWWSRLFDRGDSAGASNQAGANGRTASSNGRYDTSPPQYVGTESVIDDR